MSSLLMRFIPLAVIIYFLQVASAYLNSMHKVNFTFNLNETIETINARSVLQCARRCKVFADCSAFEMQEENSTCIILKAATRIFEMTDKQQYMYLEPVEPVGPVEPVNSICGEEWSTFSASCYQISKDKKDYTSCESYCETFNAHLATITSEQENDFVHRSRKTVPVWIGGKRMTLNGTWMWVTGEKWEYWNWNEENLADHLCARFVPTESEWDAFRCHSKIRCICEKD